jgi:hypothetical protein
VITWFAAKLIGLMLGAPQVLATWDYLQHSVRATTEPGFAVQGSLHPLNVVQFVAPYLFETRVVGQNTHELGLYCGAVPLLLALGFGLRSAHRRLVIAACCLGAFGFLWALGEFGPFGWLMDHIPLLNKFRFPCRAIVLVHLAIAVLAALGWEVLQKKPARSSRLIWLVAGVAAVLPMIGTAFWSEHLGLEILVHIGPPIVFVAAALVWKTAQGARWPRALLVAMTVLDLAAYGLSSSISGKHEPLIRLVESVGRPGGLYRVVMPPSVDGVEGNQILLGGHKRADGYAGLPPAQDRDFADAETRRLAAVYKDWRDERLHLSTHAFDIPLPNHEPSRISITENRADAGSIFISQSYHPAWQATLDGEPVGIERTENGFMAIQTPPGEHQVELVFAPRPDFMASLSPVVA